MYKNDPTMEINNPNLFHVTLSMLTLSKPSQLAKANETFNSLRGQAEDMLKNKSLTLGGLGFFANKH